MAVYIKKKLLSQCLHVELSVRALSDKFFSRQLFTLFYQVVKYTKDGHYNAHYDSQPVMNQSHVKCCHLELSLLPHCRVCR